MRMTRQRFLWAYAVFLLVALCCSGAFGGTIALRWDAVPGATGYRMHFGTEPGVYDGFQVSDDTVGTVDGLPNCVTYYLAAKAFNDDGESANFSNEIAGWPRPELDAVTCAEPLTPPWPGEPARTVACTLTGANFVAGVAVVGDVPSGLSIANVATVDCRTVTFDVTLTDVAEPGSYSPEVDNPDGVYGVGDGLLAVGARTLGIILNLTRDDTRPE